MKRIIFIIIIIVIGAYFVVNYFKDRAEEKAVKAKEVEIEENIKATVSELVSKTNAVDNWYEFLNEKAENSLEKIPKILTIDLEKVWLGKRPILFIGYIDDVATYDNQFYILKINQDILTGFSLWLGTSLSLELKCSKEKVETFIKKYPPARPSVISLGGNNLAIIAKIEEIKTSHFSSEEDDKEEVKIGKGDCIDMIFIGNIDLIKIKKHRKD